MPITWRNIDAPSFGDALKAGALAQSSFNSGFDNLNRVLQKEQATQAANWQAQEEAAKQGYLNDLFAVEGVDALKGQRQEFMQRLQGLTPEAQAVVRGQFDQRVGALQDSTRQEAEFKDFTLDREQRPIRDGILAKLYSGDVEGASVDIAANPQLMNRPEIQKTIADYQRTLVQQGREDKRFKWDEETQAWQTTMRPLEMQAKQAQLGAAARQGKVADMQLEQAEQERRVQEVLSNAFLGSRDKLSQENGLPNPRAMSDVATRLSNTENPVVAARVLQEAARQDQERVSAWKTAEDANGLLGSTSLNPTAVMAALAPDIAAITVGSKGEVAASLSEKILKGYTVKKGTQLPGMDPFEEDLVIPIPLNVAKAALAGSDTTAGWNRGGDAQNIIDSYMERPDVIRAILARQSSEKLRGALPPIDTRPKK